jgi:hypothetical protein
MRVCGVPFSELSCVYMKSLYGYLRGYCDRTGSIGIGLNKLTERGQSE